MTSTDNDGCGSIRWGTGSSIWAVIKVCWGTLRGTNAAVTDWLSAQPAQFREQITYVVIDPSAAYAAAVTDKVLTGAAS